MRRVDFELSDRKLRAALARIDGLCRRHGLAYMAAVSRVDEESSDIVVACTSGAMGHGSTDAQQIVACCDALTELRGLSEGDLEKAQEPPEDKRAFN